MHYNQTVSAYIYNVWQKSILLNIYHIKQKLQSHSDIITEIQPSLTPYGVRICSFFYHDGQVLFQAIHPSWPETILHISLLRFSVCVADVVKNVFFTSHRQSLTRHTCGKNSTQWEPLWHCILLQYYSVLLILSPLFGTSFLIH